MSPFLPPWVSDLPIEWHPSYTPIETPTDKSRQGNPPELSHWLGESDLSTAFKPRHLVGSCVGGEKDNGFPHQIFFRCPATLPLSDWGRVAHQPGVITT